MCGAAPEIAATVQTAHRQEARLSSKQFAGNGNVKAGKREISVTAHDRAQMVRAEKHQDHRLPPIRPNGQSNREARKGRVVILGGKIGPPFPTLMRLWR